MNWYIILGDSRKKGFEDTLCKEILIKLLCFRIAAISRIINRELVRRSYLAIGEEEVERLLIMLNRDQQQFLVVYQKIVRRSSSVAELLRQKRECEGEHNWRLSTIL